MDREDKIRDFLEMYREQRGNNQAATREIPSGHKENIFHSERVSAKTLTARRGCEISILFNIQRSTRQDPEIPKPTLKLCLLSAVGLEIFAGCFKTVLFYDSIFLNIPQLQNDLYFYLDCKITIIY